MNVLAQEDKEWLESISRHSCSKVLVQHIGCMNQMHIRSGQTHIDSALDQVLNMKRVFMSAYDNTDYPFGIRTSSGKLPKCISICNLSGKHAFLYSERVSLARVMTYWSEKARAGIEQVIAKAHELDATVILFFSLPFQVGLDRAYFEARTVRKTKKGAVKDGEMFFSSHDVQARTVPCTLSFETCSEDLVDKMTQEFVSLCSPVSLDVGEESSRELSQEQAVAMVEVLKAERTKLIETHNRAIENVKANAIRDVEKLKSDLKQSKNSIDAEVKKAVDARKATEDGLRSKNTKLEEQNKKMTSRVSALEISEKDAQSRMQGMELQHAQELEKCGLRQKELETQVCNLQASHARQVSEQARSRKELERKHLQTTQNTNQKYEHAKKQASAMKIAAEAVTKSADEARRNYSEARAALAATIEENEATTLSLNSLQSELEVLKSQHSVLEIGKARVDEELIVSTAAASRNEIATNTLLVELKREDRDFRELSRELSRTRHLLSETDKHAKALRSRIVEVESECKRLKKQLSEATGNRSRTSQDGKEVHSGHNGHGGQNGHNGFTPTTAQVYQPHYGFPTSFEMDPHLEAMISQLHGALQSITATARSASFNSRNAAVLSAKLDALAGTVPVTAPNYPDTTQHSRHN